MKCEEFISNLETGSAVTRLRARLHARNCPQCFAMQHQWNELRDALGAPANLTPFHRRVWERVAVDTVPAPARSWLTGPRLALAGGLAVAAAVLVAIALSVGNNNTPSGGTIVKSSRPLSGVETRVLKQSPEDLAALHAGLDQVELDLKRLAEDADRLEARRAISELAALFPPIGSADSS